MLLGFALVVGVIAALAANRFLAARIDAIEARSRGAMVEVVVARFDLPKGQEIGPDNVALRAIPRDYAHSNAMTSDSFGRAAGRKLAYNVKAGEMLLSSLLETPRPPTFSARVSAGRRAMTVEVDEINSISGLLEPGDVIDLIAGLERKGKKLTVPLLQGLQVMATGQRVADDPVTGERRQYATVTLNVTPSQATALIAARAGGKITALLRNPADTLGASTDALDLDALLGNPDNDAAGVPVLYGGSSVKFPPEALRLGAYRDKPEASAAMRGSGALGSSGVSGPAAAGAVPVLSSSIAGALQAPDLTSIPPGATPALSGASAAADSR